MGQAHDTITYAPAVAGKPGKLVTGSTGVAASDDIFEAADIKNKPVRIGKGVAVRPLNRDPVIRPSDCLAALAADDVFFLLRLRRLFLFVKNSNIALGI
jgi:hypothetical protein